MLKSRESIIFVRLKNGKFAIHTMLTEEEKNAGLVGRIIPINIEEQMKTAYIEIGRASCRERV